jgi:hypothetical protein
MKKFILIIVIFLVPLSSAFSEFGLGIKAGYNASKFSTDKSEISSGFSNGFLFGAYARIGETLFFQPELLYSIHGGTFSSTIQTVPSPPDLNQASFDLCAMAGYYLIDAKAFKLNAQAGLVASIMTDKGAWNIDPVTTTDFQNVNWSLKFGAGADFSNLSLDIRYLLGLNNVNSSSQFEMKNSRVEVTLGLRFLSF